MGRIAINGMRFYAHHGCFAEERVTGIHFHSQVDQEMGTYDAFLCEAAVMRIKAHTIDCNASHQMILSN